MNLDERVVARIRQAQQKLESEGNLPSRAELDGYRRNFRERFGPEGHYCRLAALGGAIGIAAHPSGAERRRISGSRVSLTGL